MINNLYSNGELVTSLYSNGLEVTKAYSLGTVVFEKSILKSSITLNMTVDDSVNWYNIYWGCKQKTWDGILEYSLDGTTWMEFLPDTVISGKREKIEMRGTGNTYLCNDSEENTYLMVTYNEGTINTAMFDITGKIESLLDHKTVAAGGSPTMAANCFKRLFAGNENLRNPPEFSSVTLSDHCYDSTFLGCRSMESLPILPATVMQPYCYRRMFRGCFSLNRGKSVSFFIPEASEAEGCWEEMYSYCNLVTKATGTFDGKWSAPRSRYGMFDGCGSLQELEFTTISIISIEANCMENAFRETGLYSPIILAIYFFGAYSCKSMFEGCKNIRMSNSGNTTYNKTYKLPNVDTGGFLKPSYGTDCFTGMFARTSGVAIPTPVGGTTYYFA